MHNLKSFANPINALVVGAGGGLGRAFVDALAMDDGVRIVYAWSRQTLSGAHDKIVSRIVDVGDENQVQAGVAEIDRLNLIIVATGILHNGHGLRPEKSYKMFDPAHMAEYFHVNAILPAMIAKHTLAFFPRNERAVFCALSARVGSISDNRLGGWYSYRATKSALNQIIKCLSIELRRTHPGAVCIGLHPGTVATDLSKPFQKSLTPGHQLLTPAQSATYLLSVIDKASPNDSGLLMAWDGECVPP